MAANDSTKTDGVHGTKNFMTCLPQRALVEKKILEMDKIHKSAQQSPVFRAQHGFSLGTCTSFLGSPSENLHREGKVSKSCSKIGSHVQSASLTPVLSSKVVSEKSPQNECEAKARRNKTSFSRDVQVPKTAVVSSKQCKESSNPDYSHLTHSSNQLQSTVQGSTELTDLLEQKSLSQISLISDKHVLTELVSLISSALDVECADLDTVIRKLKHMQNQNMDITSKDFFMLNNAKKSVSEFLHKLSLDKSILKRTGRTESFPKASPLDEKDNTVEKCTEVGDTSSKLEKWSHGKDSTHVRSPHRDSHKKSRSQCKTEKRESSKSASEKLSISSSSSPDEHTSIPCKRSKTSVSDSMHHVQGVVHGSDKCTNLSEHKAHSVNSELSNENILTEMKQLIRSATNLKNVDLDTFIGIFKLIHNQIFNLSASENSSDMLSSAQKLVSEFLFKLSKDQPIFKEIVCCENFCKATGLDVQDKKCSKIDNTSGESKNQSANKDCGSSVKHGRSPPRSQERGYDWSQCKAETRESSESVSKKLSIRVSTEEDHTESHAKYKDCSKDEKLIRRHKRNYRKRASEENSQPESSPKRLCVPTKNAHDLSPTAQSSSKISHHLQKSTSRRSSSSSRDVSETERETHDKSRTKCVEDRNSARHHQTLSSVRSATRLSSDKGNTKMKVSPLNVRSQRKCLSRGSPPSKSPPQSRSNNNICGTDRISSSTVGEIVHSEIIKNRSCDIHGKVNKEEMKVDSSKARKKAVGLPGTAHKVDSYLDALEPISDESLSDMTSSECSENTSGRTTQNQNVQKLSSADPVLTAMLKTIEAANALFPELQNFTPLGDKLHLLTSVQRPTVAFPISPKSCVQSCCPSDIVENVIKTMQILKKEESLSCQVNMKENVRLLSQHSSLSRLQHGMAAQKCQTKENWLNNLTNAVKDLDLELMKKVKVGPPELDVIPAKKIKQECDAMPTKLTKTEHDGTPTKLAKTERDGAPAKLTETERDGTPTKLTKTERDGTPTKLTKTERDGTPTKLTKAERDGTPTKLTKTECDGTPTKLAKTERDGAPAKLTETERDGTPTKLTKIECGGTPTKTMPPCDAALDKTLNAKGSPDQQQFAGFTYFDPGNHWCQCCDKVLDTVQDMLTHLKSAEHKKHMHPLDKPWVPKTVRKIITKMECSYHKLCKPVKGVQFLVPTDGFYCSLCKQNFGDKTCAEDHLASDEHNSAYEILTNITLKSANLQNKPDLHENDEQKSSEKSSDVKNCASPSLYDLNSFCSIQSETSKSFLVSSPQYQWLPLSYQWQLLYPQFGALLHPGQMPQPPQMPPLPQVNSCQVVPPSYPVQSPMYQGPPAQCQVQQSTVHQVPPPPHQVSPPLHQVPPPLPQVPPSLHQIPPPQLHVPPPPLNVPPPPLHQILPV